MAQDSSIRELFSTLKDREGKVLDDAAVTGGECIITEYPTYAARSMEVNGFFGAESFFLDSMSVAPRLSLLRLIH
jgi:hypothetical protein